MKIQLSLNKFKNIFYFAAFFRVSICLLLLIDFFFLRDIFKYFFSEDYTSFLKTSIFFNLANNNYKLIFIGYIISIFIYLFGIAHYFGAFLFYFFFFIVSIMLNNISLWGDLILLYTMLFFIFVNSYNHFTLFKNNFKFNSFLEWISILAFVCIIMHLYYILLINLIHKVNCPNWLDGSALSIGIHLEKHMLNSSIFLKLAQNKFFSQLISYSVLLQQALFIPFTLFNYTRRYMVIFSLLIHFSIMVVFIIVKFQLIMFFLYGFIMYIPYLKSQLIKNLK